MDASEEILKLDERFQKKNNLIIAFFTKAIEEEDKPKVVELLQYSFSQYLESMEFIDERIRHTYSTKYKIRLLCDREHYLDYIISVNGIKKNENKDKKKSVK